MPRRDPFTQTCRQFAAVKARRLADLHAHTTASDGDWTPSQLIAFATSAKLASIAVTDHDTTAGVAEAHAAAPAGLTIVAGVELSCSFRDREIHVLGLFVDPEHPGLVAACRDLCDRRRERFRGYLAAFAARGRAIPAHLVDGVESTAASPGRRHVAKLLVAAGHVATTYGAFTGPMADVASSVPPKRLLPVAGACELIRSAGGVSSLAHPPGEFDDANYDDLASSGLLAIESRHPSASNTQTDYLAAQAKRLGLSVTAGSDCHGPGAAGRSIGSHGLWPDEFAALIARAGQSGSA
jgi:predicted metal-dependent phosphoesterase TrpH